MRELGPDDLSPFDPDGRLLLNVNTPEDYARARRSPPSTKDSREAQIRSRPPARAYCSRRANPSNRVANHQSITTA